METKRNKAVDFLRSETCVAGLTEGVFVLRTKWRYFESGRLLRTSNCSRFVVLTSKRKSVRYCVAACYSQGRMCKSDNSKVKSETKEIIYKR